MTGEKVPRGWDLTGFCSCQGVFMLSMGLRGWNLERETLSGEEGADFSRCPVVIVVSGGRESVSTPFLSFSSVSSDVTGGGT